jgi:YggT family protein
MINPITALVLYLLEIYGWVVIVAVIVQWLLVLRIINTSNDIVRTIVGFLFAITEPVFRLVRRFVPSFGGIDIAPVIVLIAIWFVRYVIIWATVRSYYPG